MISEETLAFASDICMQYAAECSNKWRALIAQDCALRIRAQMKMYKTQQEKR